MRKYSFGLFRQLVSIAILLIFPVAAQADWLVVNPAENVDTFKINGLTGIGPFVDAVEFLEGSEISSGTLTEGVGYKITATEEDHFCSGCEVGDYFFASEQETYGEEIATGTLVEDSFYVVTAAEELLGDEIATGTLSEYLWYKITATETDHFYTDCAVDEKFYSDGTETCDANNKVKLCGWKWGTVGHDTHYVDYAFYADGDEACDANNKAKEITFSLPECDASNKVYQGGLTLKLDLSGLTNGEYRACVNSCYSETNCGKARCIRFQITSGDVDNSALVSGEMKIEGATINVLSGAGMRID